MDDNDVNMETAAPGQSAEQQEQSATQDDAINGDVAPQPTSDSAIASDASIPLPPVDPTNEAAEANEPESISTTAEPENTADMAMDVDPTEPVTETKPEASSDPVKAEDTNTGPKPVEDKEALPTEDTKPVSEVAVEGSAATPAPAAEPTPALPSIVVADTDANVPSIDTTKEPEGASGETPMDTTESDKPAETTEAADATEETTASTEAAPAVRTYTPQFKFTTFAPMVTLPTRNILSNFLKSDKNYVLKDIAAAGDKKKKNKKRKTSEEGSTGGGGEGGEDMAAEGVEGVENGTKKSKLGGDEGEEELREEGESGDDSSDSSDSDSDSEGSVVDEMDEDAEAMESAEMGKKIIVIHPGSRFLRIGRASDAYPVVTPHVIARRMRTGVNGQQKAGSKASEEDSAMDVDQEHEEEDVVNDRYLQEIEYDLKQRMKTAKRKPVGSAKSQVRSFNTSSQPEKILDHNDPYKVEWTDPNAEGEYVIGQKALNLPLGKHHSFKLFWPIVGGHFNDKDYTSPRVVTADLETIWTKVIQDDLGIERVKFRKHYALLIIPDLFSKVYVVELVGMLLKSMQFKGVMVQQESVCASFGAGVSAACVVDIGAEVTKIACVEDGVCIPNSRAVLKYGGDDITRCFSALVKRTGFPYEELDLTQSYDWKLMEDLKEKWCTMDEADLTVQVYSFFVRKPDHPTQKYQVKVYDEVALSPMCLFFPGVIRRWIEEREADPAFTRLINYEDINDDAPPVSLVNQAAKKSATAAAAAVAAARAGTPSSTVAGDDNSNNTNNLNNSSNNAGTPAGTPAATPAPSAVPPPPVPAVVPFQMEPLVATTDMPWEVAGTIGKVQFSSLVALDVVVAQSISNCESEERSKKLYGSIILVGGGGMIKGFDHVLEDRLFQALPATLTTVEKVEVLPSPREMDPRLLVWKGGSVLGKLETAKELWIKPLEWELLGHKILRDRALFVW
ncbi:actin-like protein arp8 [Podila minutissima]|uniref:Actin-like protein arp8 n=1 Tax=Podila minutissima TaxID=64525 RepID=A0A9P5SHF8_9FUNG|nr:actin-like protein arp8 [Podila minutissima]